MDLQEYQLFDNFEIKLTNANNTYKRNMDIGIIRYIFSKFDDWLFSYF